MQIMKVEIVFLFFKLNFVQSEEVFLHRGFDGCNVVNFNAVTIPLSLSLNLPPAAKLCCVVDA